MMALAVQARRNGLRARGVECALWGPMGEAGWARGGAWLEREQVVAGVELLERGGRDLQRQAVAGVGRER